MVFPHWILLLTYLTQLNCDQWHVLSVGEPIAIVFDQQKDMNFFSKSEEILWMISQASFETLCSLMSS